MIDGGGQFNDGPDVDDVLDGGVGDDRVIGGLGNDTLRGEAGNDRLFGSDGFDTADFSRSSRAVQVDTNLHRASGEGNDELFGDIENVIGSDFGDTLLGCSAVGGAGDDVIEGGPAADRLSGGPGNDTLPERRCRPARRGGAHRPDEFATLVPSNSRKLTMRSE